MAEIAVSFLLNELGVFLHDEKSLLGGVREEAEYIKAKLEQMRAFLSVADAKEESDPRLQVWIKQVRDVAYVTEDILEEFIVRLANNRRDGFFGSLYRITWCFNRHQQPWLDRRGDALLIEEAELVGIEQPKRQLISWLVNDDSGLKVVSVAGMGGWGKTTLVKKVYEDTKVKRHFQSHVWITVSQLFKIEELLKQVIQQLFDEVKQPVPQVVETMASHSLKELIKEFLQQSRYVLVLDDVWSLDAWIAMEIALPYNNHGSRVLLTTRNVNIASACCLKTRGRKYTMNALSPEESWTLFCRKVFQGTDCPQPLYPLSKCILEKCEGLPLAIVAMGGFLATKDRRIEEWDMVWRSLGDELESNDQFEFMTRILLFSYFDLPYHLKICLLYLSIFPEDYEIEKMRLIRLWIAEGFVQVREGKTLEEVAENYLNNLVNRSLVQVARTTIDGRRKTCRVHDLLREMIIIKSREQSIGTINSGQDAKRRCLAIHDSLENVHKSESYSRLRSLLIFGVVNPLFKSSISMFLSSQLLKVLDLRGAPLEKIPSLVFTLIHLRYLIMRGTNYTCVTRLPPEILRLRKLRHLLLYRYEFIDNYFAFQSARGFKAPCNIGDLISLQKLCYIEAEIGKLTQLRRLGITKLRSKDGMDFCSSIEKLTNLSSLFVYSAAEHEILDLQSLSSAPQFLRTLELGGRLAKLPHWIPSLHSLVTLWLCYSQLGDDPLQSLETLPNLELLGFLQAYEGENLTVVLWLCRLKGLRSLTVEDGVMPHLEEIYFHNCKLVDELHLGIQHLTNMQFLRLDDMPDKLTMPLQVQARHGDTSAQQILPAAYIGEAGSGDVTGTGDALASYNGSRANDNELRFGSCRLGSPDNSSALIEQLSLDLIEEWLSKNLSNSTRGGGLSISGTATYQPFDGLMELKM
ncbi:hypothetical protein RJ639_020728, partial [Escallonia herrerae]